jgi:hypothetical protein
VPTVIKNSNPGRKMVDAAKGFVVEMGRRLVSDWTQDGYDHASRLALGILEKRIGDLHEKIRSGGKLTQQEHYLLTILSDIKNEMERELRDNW